MKTSLLTFCFLCIAAFAFATTSDYSEHEKMPTEPSSTINSLLSTEISTANYFSCTVLHVVKFEGETVAEFSRTEPDGHPNCHGVVYHMLKHAPGT